ncbi:MAG: energy-coupling factor ABC transporter ATP-binding protein [Treponema sp.]|jgi:biotin transport system ATP-binding protein|nr:energy-coupling factor ABC transporter ATP-binding protein [Treponema sp.]
MPGEKLDQDILFEACGLCKTFPQGFTALAGIDLKIYSGECLVIAGANGSGKSVLMRILTGLLEKSDGEVFFKGVEVSRNIPLIRRSVGLVFQDADAQIIGETVEEDIRFGPENLKLSKDEIESRVDAVVKNLGLEGKRGNAPRRLSGGEKRRLAVAGILAMGCETVIMDEPFANLDWPGVVQVLTLVRELKNQKKTIVILTHELEKILAFADRLMILAEGKVQAQGNPQVILNYLNPEWGVRDPRRSYLSVEGCTWL